MSLVHDLILQKCPFSQKTLLLTETEMKSTGDYLLCCLSTSPVSRALPEPAPTIFYRTQYNDQKQQQYSLNQYLLSSPKGLVSCKMLFSTVNAVQGPCSNIRVSLLAGPHRTDPINNCRTEPQSIFRYVCVR